MYAIIKGSVWLILEEQKIGLPAINNFKTNCICLFLFTIGKKKSYLLLSAAGVQLSFIYLWASIK